ncbi:ABC transporter ATP-binding protein [soil metagenome]
MNDVIRTEGLTKLYGQRRGLDGLDLEVREGEVFGFLCPNGAGKTTTIRLLLDLIRPTSGRAHVLGQDPRSGGTALRGRIGYLGGDFLVEGSQTAGELLAFLGNLRGGIERARIEQLAERLGLALDVRIRSLSKGNRQKVGIVQAFMHQPELLILDEHTAGLDPLIQQTFLELVHEARSNGQTVFMSSHILSEVEQSADRVGIVREGRMVAVEGFQTLRARAVRRVVIEFDEPVPAEAFAGVPGIADLAVEGLTLRCLMTGRADTLVNAAARFGVASILAEEPDLEELFFALYRGEGEANAA